MPRELVPASARVSPDHTHPEEGLRHTKRGMPHMASPAERMYDDNIIILDSRSQVNLLAKAEKAIGQDLTTGRRHVPRGCRRHVPRGSLRRHSRRVDLRLAARTEAGLR